MRILFWSFVACVGMAVMLWSYNADRPADESAPLSSGFVFVSKDRSSVSKDRSSRPIKPIPFPSIRAHARDLPLDTFASTVTKSISPTDADRGRQMEFLISERVFDFSLKEAGITESALAWGRLPAAGQDEVIAGFRSLHHDEVNVAGRALSVVGGLRRDVALLTGSYLLPHGASAGDSFDTANPAVRAAVLVPLTPAQLGDPHVREQLETHFPQQAFERIVPRFFAQRRFYLLDLVGQMLWCLGGSGALIGLYATMARRIRWRIVRDPLDVLSSYKALLWGVHIAYFGLYLLTAVLIYRAPDVQDTLMLVIQKQIQGGTSAGPLGVAGTAYATRNMAIAALVTLAVNFFLGSAICLTLPSCIIPGSGALVAGGRALLWGLLLAPTSRVLARGMLPHSGTLLLEGEGYILATFFGLMVPVYLIRTELGAGVFRRYRRALALNLKGNILVIVVLAVAAVYEAIEVILQMK